MGVKGWMIYGALVVCGIVASCMMVEYDAHRHRRRQQAKWARVTPPLDDGGEAVDGYDLNVGLRYPVDTGLTFRCQRGAPGMAFGERLDGGVIANGGLIDRDRWDVV